MQHIQQQTLVTKGKQLNKQLADAMNAPLKIEFSDYRHFNNSLRKFKDLRQEKQMKVNDELHSIVEHIIKRQTKFHRT